MPTKKFPSYTNTLKRDAQPAEVIDRVGFDENEEVKTTAATATPRSEESPVFGICCIEVAADPMAEPSERQVKDERCVGKHINAFSDARRKPVFGECHSTVEDMWSSLQALSVRVHG